MVLLVGGGGFSLYVSLAKPNARQLFELMTGAFLLSLGLVLAYFQGKRVLKWVQSTGPPPHNP